ncbi:hypothetical protein ACN20G_36375 (plasmid) [Streptomyces sp. BI20]|uniref:hypothetical protein n=1 Tax=Streptomyces sp. BI20 TaxID=3403460 RepID=UPI003C71B29C
MDDEIGLRARVLSDGRLELVAPATGRTHHCGPRGTSMWLALSQNAWEAEAATLDLAGQWGLDPANLSCELTAWMAHFRELGR